MAAVVCCWLELDQKPFVKQFGNNHRSEECTQCLSGFSSLRQIVYFRRTTPGSRGRACGSVLNSMYRNAQVEILLSAHRAAIGLKGIPLYQSQHFYSMYSSLLSVNQEAGILGRQWQSFWDHQGKSLPMREAMLSSWC